LLIAQGRLSFVAGAGACYLGIVLSDLGLFGLGRWLGRSWLRKLVRQRAAPNEVEAAVEWLLKRRVSAVFASRFTPGLRLPTYVAVGALGVQPYAFAALFVLAAAVWTPLLVGAGALAGAAALQANPALWALGGVAAAAIASARSREKLWKARRRLVGRIRRWAQWEFWPVWAAYAPVLGYVAFLALKRRSLTLFTAANPAFDGAGGLVGESKARILGLLARAGAPVAAFRVLRAGSDLPASLTFPAVVKPDVGERGRGVTIVRSWEKLHERLRGSEEDLILQEYVDGLEFGIFYYRFPGQPSRRILSVASKTFPEVVGDGFRTLEELVLANERAVCLAETYLRGLKVPRDTVLPAGAKRRLVEVGSHCRGSMFLDASHLATAALLARLDAISAGAPGFHFGRYDVRVRSAGQLARGEGFRILELNGVASESANIYDPEVSLLEAYRNFFHQWRIAFEIGACNRELGHEPVAALRVAELIVKRKSRNVTSRLWSPTRSWLRACASVLRLRALSGPSHGRRGNAHPRVSPSTARALWGPSP
jgi:membrane protein DedA with SNARE-associated domain